MEVFVQAATMTTFENERDHDMLAWLHVTVNPELSFQLTRFTVVSGDPAHATKDHPAKFAVAGNFTLNKVSKPLEAQAAGWREGKLLIVVGTTKVNTESHGLPIIKKFFMTVDKNVDVEFHLAFDLPRNLQWAAAP
jgi:polyisoprenoid-binding protein YceI